MKLESINTVCTTPHELIKSEEFMKGMGLILKKVEVFDKEYIESLFFKLQSRNTLKDEEKESLKTFLSDSEVARLGQELLLKLGKVKTKDRVELSSFPQLLDEIFTENGFLKVKFYIGEVAEIVKLNLNKYKGFTDVSINFNGERKDVYLENENLKVNSSNWEEVEGNYKSVIEIDGLKIKINPERNIIEYLEGDLAGEQLFTLNSAMKEAKNQGKRLPSTDQELIHIIDNVGIEEFLKKKSASCYILEDSIYTSREFGNNSFLVEKGVTKIKDYISVLARENYGVIGNTNVLKKYFFSVRCIKAED